MLLFLGKFLPSDEPRTLALPARVGCGLAKGHWPDYLAAVADVATAEGLAVVLYDNEAEGGSVSPTTGQVARTAAEHLRAQE